MFEYTHTEKDNRKKFVDKRSERVMDKFKELRTSTFSSQQIELCSSNMPIEDLEIYEDELFLTTTGRKKKCRVYSFGNVAPVYYPEQRYYESSTPDEPTI